MSNLEEYRAIVGSNTLEELYHLSQYLEDKSVLHINSTAVGGGVAEILNRIVPFLCELGMEANWEVVKGGEDFYATTKRFHNALHGNKSDVVTKDYMIYEDTLDQNLSQMRLDKDFVFIHDPQPAALVKNRRNLENHWIWRCHIDLSQPDPLVWDYFKSYVEQYDACVFSAPSFAQRLSIPQVLISPSIDPLSDKNRDLHPEEIESIMERLNIPDDKPLVTQVSRFDRLKDPLGVIETFRKITPYVDARLLLVGGTAGDDPEGIQVLNEVRERVLTDSDIIILCLPPTAHLEINAIQRASTIILQKSLREGFGLTVTEALWKGKPVIASAVGGIPLQILHKQSGILTHTNDGAAYWLKQLLSMPEYAKKLGANGKEHVRQNFLLTRHLKDYMLLFLSLEHPATDFIRL
ncbi:MAG: glycosyltransferase [Nitrospirae bacterium]|nr:glycosyltransferase [Nitrospirota bacterium]MBI3593733.1 glycosyltransferase [Nitrospirota bacterium]